MWIHGLTSAAISKSADGLQRTVAAKVLQAGRIRSTRFDVCFRNVTMLNFTRYFSRTFRTTSTTLTNYPVIIYMYLITYYVLLSLIFEV